MNDFTRPTEPRHDIPGVASYYPRSGRMSAPIDSPALAAVGNTLWAVALLAAVASIFTMDPAGVQRLTSTLEIPLALTIDAHTWQFFAATAAAAYVLGRAAHSINRH